MKAFKSLSNYLAIFCLWVGAVFMIVMMMVTIVDVGSRFLFKLSGGSIAWHFKGGVELVSYAMLLALLAGLACYVERSQVVVDLFTHNLNAKIKARLAGLFLLAFCVLGIILSYGLLEEAISAQAYGDVTQDLRISMAPIYAVAALFSIILTIRSLIEGLYTLISADYVETEEARA